MTRQEYIDGVRLASNQRKRTIEGLSEQYAKANNKVTIGDIIEMCQGRIRVASMKMYIPFMQHYPCMQYTGEALTKKNRPYAKPKYATLYQGDNVGLKIICSEENEK